MIKPHDLNESCRFYAHVVGCSLDLPARALVQNIVQFNGYFSCSYCEEQGVSLPTEGGGYVHSIPYNKELPKGTLRTKEKTIEYAKEAIATQSVVSACF